MSKRRLSRALQPSRPDRQPRPPRLIQEKNGESLYEAGDRGGPGRPSQGGCVMAKMKKQNVTLRVNGEAYDLLTYPHRTLLEVLREDLHLTGAKESCGRGRVRQLHGPSRRPPGPVVPAPCRWKPRAGRSPPSRVWRQPAGCTRSRRLSWTIMRSSAVSARPA